MNCFAESDMKSCFFKLLLGALSVTCSIVVADDWPQWMGPNRDGVYSESGVVKTIPAKGLKTAWRVPVHGGYAGPAVAQGRVFVADYEVTSGTNTNNPGGRDKLEGTERLLCLDATTGKEIWAHKYSRPYSISYGTGPRATPTVDGDRVYMLGAEGDLLCLKVATGDVVWKKQLAETYQAETPIWGYSAHPLIYGDLLITLAGGKGSVAVALDKMTGEPRWQALEASEIGYCPPTLIQIAGQTQLLIWSAESLSALEPKTGKLLWSEPLKPRYGMSITAPQLSGSLLFACGIGEVSKVIDIAGGKPSKVLWEGKPKVGVYCANSTPILDGEVIYGSDCGSGMMIAANLKDGTRFWETFKPTTGGENRASHGTVFITRAGDRYFLFSETGDFIIAKLSPQGYEEIGRTHVLEPTSNGMGRSVVWSHPAYANRKLFARNDKEIVCVELAE